MPSAIASEAQATYLLFAALSPIESRYHYRLRDPPPIPPNLHRKLPYSANIRRQAQASRSTTMRATTFQPDDLLILSRSVQPHPDLLRSADAQMKYHTQPITLPRLDTIPARHGTEIKIALDCEETRNQISRRGLISLVHPPSASHPALTQHDLIATSRTPFQPHSPSPSLLCNLSLTIDILRLARDARYLSPRTMPCHASDLQYLRLLSAPSLIGEKTAVWVLADQAPNRYAALPETRRKRM